MKHPAQLDDTARANAQRGLAELNEVERKGSLVDFAPFCEDRWLADTAVIEDVARVRGEWRVALVFAHVRNPLRLIRRFITAYSSGRRATLQGYYMRRLAARDQRGTLTVSVEQLELCLN